MLGGEHFRRRQQCGLRSCVYSLQHCAGSHHGFARADLALQQSHHGQRTSQIVFNLANDPTLPFSQIKGQMAQQFFAIAA